MIEILPAPDHVGAYRLSGTLTEADVDCVIADVEARLTRHEKLGLLADMTGFTGLTMKAGLRDLHYGFDKMLEWKRFSREAVVTDEPWVERLVSIAYPIVPFVKIRGFRSEQFQAALIWAGDIEGGPDD